MNDAANVLNNVRGAVDLSSLNRPTVPEPGTPGGAPAPGGFTVDLDLESFSSVVEQSAQAPVVVVLWVPTDAESAQLVTTMDSLATLYEGRFLHARADVEQYPQIAQAFQVPDYPTTVGLINGQPVPLFAGNHDAQAIQQVVEQFLAAAEANGVTGRIAVQGQVPQAPEPDEEPLPPLHQKAYDAIEAGNYDDAIAAYAQAFREDPRDTLATAGLAQAGLLQRTSTSSRQEAQASAAATADSIEAQLLVADFAVLEGDAQNAFDLLIGLIRENFGDEREVLRKRLIDYFEILGNEDPRVGPARRALASALY
ncbi:co-chaperone YbbN [Populibacterium corticicola]|uniref:Co-chaperone YbbN n=1 Tax=Populibacterium corticicola TaxID=1812826 RepID=A0ABW5XBN1_9MICO